MELPVHPAVAAQLDRLTIPFNEYGLDEFGVSKKHLGVFYTPMYAAYEHYLRVTSFGTENVPSEGGALIISNHSGGFAFDAAMILCSLLMDHDPPRHAHGMVEYFLHKWPFASPMLARVGQFTGIPEHGERLLNAGRLVLAFPEGARGTGKLYRDRYKLVRFGTGFMRLALRTGVPVVPTAFVGAEEAFPTMLHLKLLAKLIGAPYIPVPPQLIPVPLPVACQVYYGEPMHFEGDGTEPDNVIDGYIREVRAEIRQLIDAGRAARPSDFMLNRMPDDSEPLVRGR